MNIGFQDGFHPQGQGCNFVCCGKELTRMFSCPCPPRIITDTAIKKMALLTLTLHRTRTRLCNLSNQMCNYLIRAGCSEDRENTHTEVLLSGAAQRLLH